MLSILSLFAHASQAPASSATVQNHLDTKHTTERQANNAQAASASSAYSSPLKRKAQPQATAARSSAAASSAMQTDTNNQAQVDDLSDGVPSQAKKGKYTDEIGGDDSTLQRLHKAAEEQNPEMMLAIIAEKNNGEKSLELALENAFLNPESENELTRNAFKTYARAHTLITQHRKNETVALYTALDATSHMLPVICALIVQMIHPTERAQKNPDGAVVTNTVVHLDVNDAITKGDNKLLDKLAQNGWVTVSNQFSLPRALELAARHNNQKIFNRLIELARFTLLEQVILECQELSNDKNWKELTEKIKAWIEEKTKLWTAKKNEELIESNSIVNTNQALQHGANPNVLVAYHNGKAPILSKIGLDPILLELLISYGADINAMRTDDNDRRISLLEEAATDDFIRRDGYFSRTPPQYDDVQMLIAEGAQPNADLLFSAYQNEHRELFNILTTSKVFDPAIGASVLYNIFTDTTSDDSDEALSYKSYDYVTTLLRNTKTNPNAFDNATGKPIVLKAIENNYLACLALLVEHGLDLNLQFEDNGNTWSLIDWTFAHGHKEAYKTLTKTTQLISPSFYHDTF